MKEAPERRSNSMNDVLIKLGTHEKAIEVLENDKYQIQQSFINHKAETHGLIKDVQGEVRILVNELKLDFKSIISKVGRIEKFMYMAFGVGGALTVFLTFIIHWDSIKQFFTR